MDGFLLTTYCSLKLFASFTCHVLLYFLNYLPTHVRNLRCILSSLLAFASPLLTGLGATKLTGLDVCPLHDGASVPATAIENT